MKKIYLIAITTLVLQLLLISGGSASRASIIDYDKQIVELKDENRKLELEIAERYSCQAISQRADEAGFVSVAMSQKNTSVALKR